MCRTHGFLDGLGHYPSCHFPFRPVASVLGYKIAGTNTAGELHQCPRGGLNTPDKGAAHCETIILVVNEEMMIVGQIR